MQPDASYAPGDSMAVSFWTGHPDNALRRNGHYVEIERRTGSDWLTVVTDGDWSTSANWAQASRVIPPYDPLDPFAVAPPPMTEAFTVTIRWKIPVDAEPGTYRVSFNGSEKQEIGGSVLSFAVQSPSFAIEARDPR
jgi:neutral ceramidase